MQNLEKKPFTNHKYLVFRKSNVVSCGYISMVLESKEDHELALKNGWVGNRAFVDSTVPYDDEKTITPLVCKEEKVRPDFSTQLQKRKRSRTRKAVTNGEDSQ